MGTLLGVLPARRGDRAPRVAEPAVRAGGLVGLVVVDGVRRWRAGLALMLVALAEAVLGEEGSAGLVPLGVVATLARGDTRGGRGLAGDAGDLGAWGSRGHTARYVQQRPAFP
jgi:hypothetical protein